MNAQSLIVGQGVADVMVKCVEMVVDPNYGKAYGIRRVGLYGRYTVWLDPSLADNRVMVTYKAAPSDDVANGGMVDRLERRHGWGRWILL